MKRCIEKYEAKL